MKVSELTGAKLDYWTGKADGKKVFIDSANLYLCYYNIYEDEYALWQPSTDWSQGGPILERAHKNIECLDDNGGLWSACMPVQYGETMLIAGLRCYVDSKYGDEVPDEI